MYDNHCYFMYSFHFANFNINLYNARDESDYSLYQNYVSLMNMFRIIKEVKQN